MKTSTAYLLLPVLAFLGGAVFAAKHMANNHLWGNWPLVLLLGGWMAFILFNRWLRPPAQENAGLLWLSILAGTLLGLGFLFSSPLLFVGFAPLMILSERLEASDSPGKTLLQWSYAFNSFVIWNLVSTYWVANAALIPGLAAFFLNSLFMTVPWMLMILLGRKLPKWKYAAFAAFWIAFEWNHHVWEISWPWLTLGNGLAFVPKWIQWYDLTGCFGGSLWILTINILLAKAFLNPVQRMRLGTAAALIWLLPVGFGYLKYAQFSPGGQPVEIAVIQPNYEPHYEKFQIDPADQMTRFENLSRKVIGPHTQYLVWPETSFEYLDVDQFGTDWRIQRMRALLAEYPGLRLVTGIGSLKGFRDGEALTDAARENTRGGFPRFFEIQNSAIQVSGMDASIPVYVKSKLVPGVETFPYRRLLPFLKPLVDQLGGSVHGLGRQKEREVFTTGTLKIAPVICYESIYGNYIGDYIRKGAQAIFVMTNDGWWDDTPGYRQHLAFGALRAIEFRKPIARSANTGTSCFITARGDIQQATEYGKQASLNGSLLFNDHQTFYQTAGDFIAWFCAAASLCFLIVLLFIVLKARFSKNR
ncbi:MAG TPA: apolipoprotein N-acyltransferase [Saprospiraceae bacterium]|nr:apolipoprotein N-acyltransferase [Saprospiraceae bacterium]